MRKYSVIKSGGDQSRAVVATGLEFEAAKALANLLDQEYRAKVEASGKHYSSWTADLHFCELEPKP